MKNKWFLTLSLIAANYQKSSIFKKKSMASYSRPINGRNQSKKIFLWSTWSFNFGLYNGIIKVSMVVLYWTWIGDRKHTQRLKPFIFLKFLDFWSKFIFCLILPFHHLLWKMAIESLLHFEKMGENSSGSRDKGFSLNRQLL